MMRITARATTDAVGGLLPDTDLPMTGLKAGRLGDGARHDIWNVEIPRWSNGSLLKLGEDNRFSMLATFISARYKGVPKPVQFGFSGSTKAIRHGSKEYRAMGREGTVHSRDIVDSD